MTDNDDKNLDDNAMNWALGERLGGDTPPDLLDGVRAQLANGPAPTARPASLRPLLAAAAAVLFGTFVVVAVSLSNREVPQDDVVATAQEPTKPTRVSSRAEIEALPATTRNVLGIGIEDDTIPALLRLRELEVLELRAIWPSPISPDKPLRPHGTLSDDGLQRLAGMKKLRVLRLFSQMDLEGPGLEVLTHLPALRQLQMQLVTVDDDALAVLSELPKLDVLHLENCPGIGEATLERISRIATLRGLSFAGCYQLDENWIAKVARLPRLESLDLGQIGSRTYFSGISPVDLPEAGTGVTDVVLQALQRTKTLSHLDLSYGSVTAAGLRAIRDLPLVDLDLTGIEIPPEDLELLPPTLLKLSLRGSDVVYPQLGERLARAAPGLTDLDLSSSAGISDARIASLQRLGSLQSLRLAGCQNLTADAVPELCKLEWLVALDLQGLKFLTEEHLEQLRAMPNLSRLKAEVGGK